MQLAVRTFSSPELSSAHQVPASALERIGPSASTSPQPRVDGPTLRSPLLQALRDGTPLFSCDACGDRGCRDACTPEQREDAVLSGLARLRVEGYLPWARRDTPRPGGAGWRRTA